MILMVVFRKHGFFNTLLELNNGIRLHRDERGELSGGAAQPRAGDGVALAAHPRMVGGTARAVRLRDCAGSHRRGVGRDTSMAALQDLPLLARGPESANARADAHHLAVVTCAAVDHLLTWNYRHLANAQVLHRLENFWAGAVCICRAYARRKNSWEYKTMKADPILEEVWRIKDELAREYAADPDAYFAKLDEITNAEEKAGRKVIRSAVELQQLVAQRERQHAEESAFALNDKPARKQN
jgi:hypothetical protein